MMAKHRRIRWQVKLMLAALLILAGDRLQQKIAYDQGRADQAYAEIMTK